MTTELNTDDCNKRIQVLQEQADTHWRQLGALIDELKTLAPHSGAGSEALRNVRDWLKQLAGRV